MLIYDMLLLSEVQDASLYAADLGEFDAVPDHQEPDMIDPTPAPQPVEQREPPPLEFTLVENASGMGRVSKKNLNY